MLKSLYVYRSEKFLKLAVVDSLKPTSHAFRFTLFHASMGSDYLWVVVRARCSAQATCGRQSVLTRDMMAAFGRAG